MGKIFRFLAFTAYCVLGAAGPAPAANVYTLDDAYRAALGTNELVKIAEEGISQAEDRIDQTWSFLYPKLNARAGYTRFSDTLPPGGDSFIFQPLEQYQAGLVLNQPLYTGGRTLAALQTAKKLRQSSESRLQLARQDMLLQVSEAYYGVLKAQKTEDISKRSLERIERHKKVTEREARTRRTKANQSALLRANSLIAQARISLVRARDGLTIARERLSLLTGFPLDGVLAEPARLEQPAGQVDELQKQALLHREEYAGSHLNRSIAESNVKLVRGSHYPQLSAEAGVTYQDSRPSTALDATSYYAGLRLQVPLFEGGLMKAEVSEAKSKLRQAELSRTLLKKSIEFEVHEAHVNLQTAVSVLDTAKLQREYAKDGFDAVERLFADGLATSLALIDAEQVLTLAERELANTEYDRQLAILRLQKAVGTLGKVL